MRTTLQDQADGGVTCKEAQTHQLNHPPSPNKALQGHCVHLDNWGFPTQMDILKAMALVFAAQ
jgi:hypothetical protein